eukprot:COSAG02_NODE_2658_length_8313_cov_3.830411_4_plen_328_part_00
MNFLIPLISMNLASGVKLPNGQPMPSVQCGDWTVCNATPAVLMITVTIVGVGTTLLKEMLALGPSFLMTIPNLFKGMEESQMISERRDINQPSAKLKPEIKEEIQSILRDVRPQLLELLGPLVPAGEQFAAGLTQTIAEFEEENIKRETEDFPKLMKEIASLNPSALQKRAVRNGVAKEDAKQWADAASTGGQDLLQSLIMQKEAKLRNFPRQRAYKTGLVAMEPLVRALSDEVDPELGGQHLKVIKKTPTPDKSMELLDVQRGVELMAEEAVLGQAKAKVWPDVENKIALVPVCQACLPVIRRTHLHVTAGCFDCVAPFYWLALLP